MSRAVVRLVIGVALSLAAGSAVRADDLNALLDRVGARVSRYYANAQSIIAEETIRIQPETRSMVPDGFAQVFVYETRIEMTPGSADGRPQATFARHLLKVQGAASKIGGKKKPDECTTNGEGQPTPEPLVDLLPEYRSEFDFSLIGPAKTAGRASIAFEYKARAAEAPKVTWRTKQCLSYDLPRGYFRTRVWVDAETDDVLRIDEELVKRFMVDVPFDPTGFSRNATATLEGQTRTTRYEVAHFSDPDETILLPKSSEEIVRWSSSFAPRTRTTQVFSKYRRFVGESRMVASPDVR